MSDNSSETTIVVDEQLVGGQAIAPDTTTETLPTETEGEKLARVNRETQSYLSKKENDLVTSFSILAKNNMSLIDTLPAESDKDIKFRNRIIKETS
jgi:hypothetical protein